MSQLNVSAAEGFYGEVPANLQCGFCQKPVQAAFYRTMNRFACADCAGQVKLVINRNVMTPQAFLKAGGLGLLTALGCAVAWAAIVTITKMEIGIVASLIGVAVGKVVHFAAGKRRGTPFQWLAAVLAVIGVVGGKLALLGWQILELLNSKNIPVTPEIVARVLTGIVRKPAEFFSGFDLLWIAFAAYAAWRLCKAPALTVAGPYPYTPAVHTGLQFDTVEHVNAPADAEAP